MSSRREKTISNIGRSTYKRHDALSKRPLVHNNSNFASKVPGPLDSTFILRNSDQRCTMFILGPDASLKFLASFLLPSQGSELRNSTETGACPDVNSFEALSPPIVQVHLQKEPNAPEGIGSAKPLSAQNSTPNASGQSHKRNKQTKSDRNTLGTSDNCFASNSSGLEGDGLSAACSDVLLADVPKVNKMAKKKSSKKRKKKKGKNGKQSLHKKISSHVETPCDKDISAGVETSGISGLACSGAHSAAVDLSEDSIPSSSLGGDIDMEKCGSEENSNGSINDMPNLVAGRSCSTETGIHGDLPQRFTSEPFNLNQSRIDEDSSLSTNWLSATNSPEALLSSCEENTSNERLKRDISSDSSNVSADWDNAPVTDLFLDGCTSEICENCSDDMEVEVVARDESILTASTGGKVSYHSINDTPLHNLSVDFSEIKEGGSNDILDTQSSSDRAQCDSQARSSNDFHLVVSRRRRRVAKRLAKTSNEVGEITSAKMQGETGKDNACRVWQEIQKYDTECFIKKPDGMSLVDCSPESSETKRQLDSPAVSVKDANKKNLIAPSFDGIATQKSLPKALFSVDSSEIPSNPTAGGSVSDVKRKSGPISRDMNESSRKDWQTSGNNMGKPLKIPIEKQQLSNPPIQEFVPLALSESQKLLVMSPNKINIYQSEPLLETPVHVEETKCNKSVSNKACDISSLCGNKQIDTSQRIDDHSFQIPTMTTTLKEPHSDRSNSFEIIGSMYQDHSVVSEGEQNRWMKSESGCHHAGDTKPDSSLVPILQKWIPVGRSNSAVAETARDNNLKALAVDKLNPLRLNSKDVVESLSSSLGSDSISADTGLQYLSQHVDDPDCPTPEAKELTTKFRCQAHIEVGHRGISDNSAVLDHHCSQEGKEKSNFDLATGLDMIVKTADKAYKVQIASEGFQLFSGSPVAEFERLLYAASPVLAQSDYIRSCKICPQHQILGECLCPHQTPCMSLGDLWKWYEKPSNYGLEIKMDDYNDLEDSWLDNHEVHAYFVPYLSAVQLFGPSSSCSCKRNGNPKGMTFNVDKSTSLSVLGSLPFFSKHLSQPIVSKVMPEPMFSKPLPQPHKEVGANVVEPSSSVKEEICSHTGRRTNFVDRELIFEYFESDKPQQRKPLFKKINELAKGGTSSNCQIFGDPLNLKCCNLHDLDPASWFSVAWYPIYRIPSGNFHAAFLTYHSLGHFTYRRKGSSQILAGASIVSPIVGLESYYAKVEGWFKPRELKAGIVPMGVAAKSNPSEIVEERLRALEQAAQVMSRASVPRGGQISVNRHPDYEFFLSRKR